MMQKNVVISGADGFLGKAIVQKFLSENYFVARIQRQAGAGSVLDNQKEYTADLTSEEATGVMVKQILTDLKKIDVLVCTAGGFAMNRIENASAADIQKQLNLNFFTAYNLLRPIYLQMKNQGRGRIFLTGSRQGSAPGTGGHALAYTLSKSLLFALADTLNADKDSNIIVTVVVPSIIDTPANRTSMPDADFAKWVSPESIAEVISFYASEAADSVRQPIVKVYNHS